MSRHVLAGGIAALAAASPAAAQAPQQLTWALTTCLKNVKDFAGARRAFEKAGFGHELEDFGGGPGDQIHWYAAPDGRLDVAVVVDRSGGACRITPKGLTVGEVAPFARQGAEKLLGVPFTPGSPQGDANPACSSWARVSGRNVQVETATAGNNPECLAMQPAQIMINVTKG